MLGERVRGGRGEGGTIESNADYDNFLASLDGGGGGGGRSGDGGGGIAAAKRSALAEFLAAKRENMERRALLVKKKKKVIYILKRSPLVVVVLLRQNRRPLTGRQKQHRLSSHPPYNQDFQDPPHTLVSGERRRPLGVLVVVSRVLRNRNS